MTWEEMQNEMIADIRKIVAADTSARYIVSVVQWKGEIIGRVAYWPSPFELVGDGGATHGMSMMPKPPSDWKAVEMRLVPKADGKPSKADVPLAYFVMGEKGNGVAFPARYGKGRIGWSHNPEIIDHVGDMLLLAGLLELQQAAEKIGYDHDEKTGNATPKPKVTPGLKDECDTHAEAL